MKTKRFSFAICLLLISATLLGTASFAWFSMNTKVNVEGIQVEAYSDSLYLEIAKKSDMTYKTSVDLSSNGEVALRLATHGFVGEKVYTINATLGSGNYTGSNTWYKLVGATGDSNKKYVKVTLQQGSDLTGLYQNVEFTQVTANNAVAETGIDYYEISEGKYVKVTVTVGTTPVKGYYTVANAGTEATGKYTGGENYYYKADDGAYYADVTSTLQLGTDLSQFYTITEEAELNSTAALGEVYLKNDNGEYAYYGKYDTVTDISNELYFGRAYSDVLTDGDTESTLNIITDDTALKNYRYTDTIYIRNAINTNNSKNLQANFTIGGADNSLRKALRVLLVVTNIGEDDKEEFVTTVTYDARTGNVKYDNLDGIDTNDKNIVDVLLGNTKETLKVEIYVYFDGTDADANNKTVEAGILNGQTVSIEFTIDKPAYNQTPETP